MNDVIVPPENKVNEQKRPIYAVGGEQMSDVIKKGSKLEFLYSGKVRFIL